MLKVKIMRSGHQVAEILVNGTAEISTRCGFATKVEEVEDKKVESDLSDMIAESFKCEGTV